MAVFSFIFVIRTLTKSMKKLFYYSFILLLFSCNNITSGELKSTQVIVEIVHINMNTLQHNIPKDTTFTITNVGEYPLIIQNVETSCGCTTPSWTRKPIKPGKKGEIKVIYDAKYPGRFHKTITVFSNVDEGSIKLSISGEVEFCDQKSVSGSQ